MTRTRWRRARSSCGRSPTSQRRSPPSASSCVRRSLQWRVSPTPSRGAGCTPRSPSRRRWRPVSGARCAALGDDSLPALSPASRVRWLETREQLRGTPRFGADRRYLVPPSGLSLGQYLLARSVDASPVAGRMTFAASGSPPTAPSAGDIVVVTSDGSAARTVAAAASLGVSGLRVVRSRRCWAPRRRAPARPARPSAPPRPPMTTASPRMIPAGPSGARAQLSPTSSGAARTGITTWTTKTSGATCVAGRRCSADISLRIASPELKPVATVHSDGEEPLMRAQRIGDELRRQPAPRERGAGREGGGDAAHAIAPAQRVGRQGHGGQTGQGEGQRPAADVMRGRGRRDDRQDGDAGDDRADGQHVARADGLVERPRAQHQQQHEAEGERRLHDGERREQQRGGLQRPADHARAPCRPASAAGAPARRSATGAGP